MATLIVQRQRSANEWLAVRIFNQFLYEILGSEGNVKARPGGAIYGPLRRACPPALAARASSRTGDIFVNVIWGFTNEITSVRRGRAGNHVGVRAKPLRTWLRRPRAIG